MLASMLQGSVASEYGSLADPPGASVLLAAVSWLEGTLLGTIATTAAIVATASVGFMMLSGRVSIRPGLGVILGSFILFGAATIVSGRQSSMAASTPATVSYAPPPPPALAAPARASAPTRPPVDDPYGGASVPGD